MSIPPIEIQTIPFNFQEYPLEEIQKRALKYYHNMSRRRTIRDFSKREVPIDVIENCIRAADTAPSGANQHPWHFVVVTDQEKKLNIRVAAEKEEKEFYSTRAPQRMAGGSCTFGNG